MNKPQRSRERKVLKVTCVKYIIPFTRRHLSETVELLAFAKLLGLLLKLQQRADGITRLAQALWENSVLIKEKEFSLNNQVPI